jgi:CHASE2 domain-containing sensor protein
MGLVVVAHLINILVAGYFGVLLLTGKSSESVRAYGEDTAARQILACLYLSIALMSIVALVYTKWIVLIGAVLFPLQVIYKLLTLIAVKDKSNPIPRANLMISIFHGVTLYVIFSQLL